MRADDKRAAGCQRAGHKRRDLTLERVVEVGERDVAAEHEVEGTLAFAMPCRIASSKLSVDSAVISITFATVAFASTAGVAMVVSFGLWVRSEEDRRRRSPGNREAR